MNATIPALLLLVALAPSRLPAQGAMHFQALAIPPNSVGTCASRRLAGNGGNQPVVEYRLVMTGRAPSRRRELIVSVDTSGRATRYAEMGNISTGLLSSYGDGIIATIDTANRVRGFRIHNTVRTSDTTIGRADAAASRTANGKALVQSSHEPLDAAAQRRVKELVALVRKRCPIRAVVP